MQRFALHIQNPKAEMMMMVSANTLQKSLGSSPYYKVSFSPGKSEAKNCIGAMLHIIYQSLFLWMELRNTTKNET